MTSLIVVYGAQAAHTKTINPIFFVVITWFTRAAKTFLWPLSLGRVIPGELAAMVSAAGRQEPTHR